MRLCVNFTPLKKRRFELVVAIVFTKTYFLKSLLHIFFFGHCYFYLYILIPARNMSNKMSHIYSILVTFSSVCVVPADISSFHHIAPTINRKKRRKMCARNKKIPILWQLCVAQRNVCTQVRCQVRHNMCVFNHMYI